MHSPRPRTILRALCLAGCCGAVAATRADDLGAREWPLSGQRECVVLAALSTPVAREFHAAFSRQWCLQGWSANSQLLLRESAAARWMTHVDILRNDELLLSVPMSPYVEQNLERVAAAVVGQIAGYLLRTDANAPAGNLVPAPNQPGGERK